MKLNRVEEEYLKTIYHFVQKKGEARVSDIAKRLSIRPSSVTEMIQKLYRKGFVDYERYTPVTLTPAGEIFAKAVCKRHAVLIEFLKLLGVNKKIAESDACKMEHVVHTETVTQLMNFMNFIRNTPNCMKNWQDLV